MPTVYTRALMFTQSCVQNRSLIHCSLHVVLIILCKGLYGERKGTFYVFPLSPRSTFLQFLNVYCELLLTACTPLCTFVLFVSMTEAIVVKTILYISSVAQLLMCWVIYSVSVKQNLATCKICSQTCLTYSFHCPAHCHPVQVHQQSADKVIFILLCCAECLQLTII